MSEVSNVVGWVEFFTRPNNREHLYVVFCIEATRARKCWVSHGLDLTSDL
jgi:hypothetical protein